MPRGGLGEVFLAVDRELNRQVALKSIQAGLRPGPGEPVAVRPRGRRSPAGWSIPGIVPVYGLGRYPDGRPYYVMRFIQGETLKAAISRFHGPDAARQDSGRARACPSAGCSRPGRGVQRRSPMPTCRGVVHRDLKPDNIMLGPFGETLVVDWGMAKSFADLDPAEDAPEPLPPRTTPR